MKSLALSIFFSVSLLFTGTFTQANATDNSQKSYSELKKQYKLHSNLSSDINEHLPTLKALALECHSVAEIGVRNMVSTWAILYALSKNNNSPSYLGIDLELPPKKKLSKAKKLAQSVGINFNFWQVNDMTINIPNVDLLFIDSLHTYCHLTYELETFSAYANKYIALHDTSEPWDFIDDYDYRGDYSEYPEHINRTKKGLWPAVEDFLATHPEWILFNRYTNSHGFTVLKRVN